MEKKERTLAFRVHVAEADAIVAIAEARDMRPSDVLREAIREYVAKSR